MRANVSQLIETLRSHADFVSAKLVAAELGVSSKTVYRLVDRANVSADTPEVEKSPGKGLRLMEQTEPAVPETPSNQASFTPLQRRNKELLVLLFKAPYQVPADQLFGEFYISESTQASDLTALGEALDDFGLRLNKTAHRYSVEGTEAAVRTAINRTLANMNLFSVSGIQEFSADAKDLNPYDQQFITQELMTIEKKLGEPIPYPYNINIFSHLYILIMRQRMGTLMATASPSLTPRERSLIDDNAVLYQIVTDVIAAFNHYLNTKMPYSETVNLLQYLLSIRLQSQPVRPRSLDPQVKAYTEFLYTEVNRLENNQIESGMIMDDLVNHIQPMLNRNKNGIIVVNVWLDETRRQYRRLFDEIRGVMTRSESLFQLQPISDSEVGFITLYFARCLEQQATQKRVAIMCTTGVGTSMLIKVKVHKAFPDFDIVRVMSLADYETVVNDTHPDLVISTVAAEPINATPVVVVSALFSEADRRRIAKALKMGAGDAD